MDGTGNPWFKADIAVSNGKIVQIGDLSQESAERFIDAEGQVVAPGFIDIHTHSDFSLLVNPKAESMIRQGVTTLVIGNCGHTPYPVNEETKEDLKRIIIGYMPEVEIDWVSLDGYMKRLDAQGVSVNVVPLVGHGSLRVAVMGFASRLPTDDELGEMKRLLERELKDGAFGFSTGLEYPPGFYSNTEELIELCKVVAKYGRLYATHIRDRGEGMIAATKEAIKIGELTGVPVHISHHVPRYPFEDKADEVLALIDEARMRGLDVTCDALIPFVLEDKLPEYMFAPGILVAMLPEWAFEGGVEKLLERLRDEETRREIRIKNTKAQARLALDGQWHRIFITHSDAHPEFNGKSIQEIAKAQNKDPWDVVFDLILAEGANCYNIHTAAAAYTLKDGIKVLKHPTAAPESDGLALATYGPLKDLTFGMGSYGYIPYFFEKYVRERKLFTVEEAVRKCTSLPAQRLNMRDRGLLREGMWADIVIFNPNHIRCRATFSQPNQYPEGIDYVIVNGEVVVERGEHTGALSGKPLRAK